MIFRRRLEPGNLVKGTNQKNGKSEGKVRMRPNCQNFNISKFYLAVGYKQNL